MNCIRRYSTKEYFSRSPLNYETYTKRLHKFRSSLPSFSAQKTGLEPFLLDSIRASRTLQANSRAHTPTKSTVSAQTLGLSQPSKSQLESLLWQFLYESDPNIRRSFIDSGSSIKDYITRQPRPTDFERILKLGVENFERSTNWQSFGILDIFKNYRKSTIDTSVVYTILHTLLDRKDYYNGFLLVDATIASEKYTQKKALELKTSFACTIIGSVLLSGIEYTLLPLIPFPVWTIASLTLSLTVYFGLLKGKLISKSGRLSWRSYNSMIYNISHQEELLAVNKILTHFEEHNEVNVRNFHHSEVRKESNMNMFDQNEYILEMPVLEMEKEPEISQLQAHFKAQLNRRKMVLNDLPEELIFLEFWLTHGENFEWVEPDQDPSEIVKLQIKNQHKDNVVPAKRLSIPGGRI